MGKAYSEVNPSQGETNLLPRGLKFAPIPPRVNRFELKKDLEAFGGRLRLKEFFYNSDEDEFNPNQHRFKEKSTWNPPRNRDPALKLHAHFKLIVNPSWKNYRPEPTVSHKAHLKVEHFESTKSHNFLTNI